MSSLVFLSGGFSSGSTLPFTLFRKSEEYYCLYEPLHERLPLYLIAGLRQYERHYFVKNYFREYRGFDRIPELFDPGWGLRGFHLSESDEAPELHRYLSYLIGVAFGRHPKVFLKFNRATFRLAWLRKHFPFAKIIHIYRDLDEQWTSLIRRGQAHFGREDIGQEDVNFNAANLARWCDDLSETFPELAASRSDSGYERFSKLWKLSYAANRRYADLNVRYGKLVRSPDRVLARIWAVLGCTSDYRELRKWIVPPDRHVPLRSRKSIIGRARATIDDASLRLARLWLRIRRKRDFP